MRNRRGKDDWEEENRSEDGKRRKRNVKEGRGGKDQKKKRGEG